MEIRLFSLLIWLGLSSAWAGDDVTPIDPLTGKVMVAPQDSSLSEYVTTGPPNPNPPPYTLLRYTERYTYLADPSKRTDFFDAYKYISLDKDNPESYLSFGGELRERFEYYNNQAFGVKGAKNTNYDLQRILLHTDLHVNERLRIFAQGISSLQFGGVSSLAINQNPLDLQQAFADYVFGNPNPDGNRLTVRGGRFSMTYGAGRLIATRAAPNTPLKFDGFQFIGSMGGKTKLYGFMTHPAMEEKFEVSKTNYSQTFAGIYGSTPIGGALDVNADLYYLMFKNQNAKYADGTGVENRHSMGIRLFGNKANWDYDLESVYQFGSLGVQNIQAWTVATDFGYRFLDMPWMPRLGVKADAASGTTKKGSGIGTFNPLFFKAGYFNDAAVISPANIFDVHLSMQMQPREDMNFVLGSDILWRYSKNDALYNPGGAVMLPANFGSMYVGTTAEVALQWSLTRHLVGTLSYVHIFTGKYAHQSGGGDVDFLASWLSFTW
ncbi:alginate export family protein [Methylomonas sp. AM2-LC]|uniref:alginate export family protein n=1 Tax=Methylomonas sp. AM2-LC TaxID=3153301 RepID=UPI003265CF6F